MGHQMLCCFSYCSFLHTQCKVSRRLCNLIAESACCGSLEMSWLEAQVTLDLDKSRDLGWWLLGWGIKLPVLSLLGKVMWASAGPVECPQVRKI